MKIPGWTRNTQDEPQPSIEHERLDKLFSSRRGLGPIGCGVIVLIWLVGSSVWWTISKRNYSIRAEVSVGMSLTFSMRKTIEEYFKEHGELPTDNEEAGLPPPKEITGDYVSQISVQGGALVVVHGNKARGQIAGKELTLVPDTSKSPEFSWTCTSVDIPDKWLNSMCQTR